MNTNLKLIAAALLVAALAGCGGGGGSEDGSGTPPEKTELEKANDRADAAKEEAATQKKRADDLEQANRDADEEARLAKAQKDAYALRMAIASAFTGAAPDNEKQENRDASNGGMVTILGKAFKKQYEAELKGHDGNLPITNEDGTGLSDEVMAKHISAKGFGTSGEKTHDHITLNDEGQKVVRLSGSYHGVPGTFTCTSPGQINVGCKSNYGLDDTLSLTGTWVFRPANPATKVTDGSAVAFGWWTHDLDKDEKTAGVYHVPGDGIELYSAFGGGGTATYKGDAIGQYAIHRGAGAENDSGEFTADVTLEADFGPTAGGGTIRGMVDNFKGADKMGRDWEVKLMSAKITDGAWASPTDRATSEDPDAYTVWTMDGAKGSKAGGWKGGMYHAVGSGAALTPTAAGGVFAAEHGNIANMIGAFGADLDD